MEWSLTQNKLLAFHRLMRTDKPIGALLLVDCRASAGVGVPVYEAVYPSTASGAGRGVWLVDSNGFCRCE